MKSYNFRRRFYFFCSMVGFLSSVALTSFGQSVPLNPQTSKDAPKMSPDQLDSLVAPIALYPDPLLAQILAASTYPLEIVQLQQWLGNHKDLKGKALADAVSKENWDPGVQAMAAFPEVVQRLEGNIEWTTNLGNAFLAQQSDVMAAVQRMRAKAQGKGNLKTNSQQVVKTQATEGKQVIVIEPAQPDVVYIPSYDPEVIFGPPLFPYYPFVYPGYYPGMGLAFGAGFALGAAWGGAWGWGCGWAGGDIHVNVNNTYINNFNQRNNIHTNNNTWQHNAQHRGNAPYGNRSTRNQYANRGQNQHQESANRSEDRNRAQHSAGGEDRNRPSTRTNAGGDHDRIGNRSASGGSFGDRSGGFGREGGESGRDFGGFDRGGGGFGRGGGDFGWASSNRGNFSMGGGGFRGGGFGGGGFRGGGRR